ncbi:gamma-glutamylcyclotransferase [Thalassotalea insulae]|uniref:Gamma-glutamylcyclotransferase n=1 Tax=Thalassotalea insulae TaxID=2056778 RepID=A0ABQ6GSF0_9GAMM|nr:gamma-glutamylcyclotransferase family protein [Thalassotalea insulae]GLX78322.1 gamma-glutamylcyclotransferase [Thalassotalea insulae]
MKYFAYGSNMSLLRLTARVPSAKRIGLYQLNGHRLRFDKASHDGSGKGNIEQTNNQEDKVFGAIFDIADAEKAALDAVEGLGVGYEIKIITVEDYLGNQQQAFTYYATDINPLLSPYYWYLNHVIIGAKEIGVPKNYLENIQSVNSIEDPNTQRSAQEYAIYLK